MDLQFSKYQFTIKAIGEQQLIFDIIRRKYVVLTPEEWVRQHILHYLISDQLFPKSLISVEKQLTVNELSKRTDIVLFNQRAEPVLIVECKAPAIKISQKTFEQAAHYNLALRVRYLWVTNGSVNYLSQIDHEKGAFIFLNTLPGIMELTG